MKISTRGRYALRAMVDLAEQDSDDYIPLGSIAARQEISPKYIESIMSDLSKAGLVDGKHGKGGGYKLNRPSEEYNVGEILKIAEGDIYPVECMTECSKPCNRSSFCKTLKLWQDFYALIDGYFASISLKDVTLSQFSGKTV